MQIVSGCEAEEDSVFLNIFTEPAQAPGIHKVCSRQASAQVPKPPGHFHLQLISSYLTESSFRARVKLSLHQEVFLNRDNNLQLELCEMLTEVWHSSNISVNAFVYIIHPQSRTMLVPPYLSWGSRDSEQLKVQPELGQGCAALQS